MMKIKYFLFSLLFCMVTLSLSSCHDDDDQPTPAELNIEKLQSLNISKVYVNSSSVTINKPQTYEIEHPYLVIQIDQIKYYFNMGELITLSTSASPGPRYATLYFE